MQELEFKNYPEMQLRQLLAVAPEQDKHEIEQEEHLLFTLSL
jgi:hypothetical protein